MPLDRRRTNEIARLNDSCEHALPRHLGDKAKPSCEQVDDLKRVVVVVVSAHTAGPRADHRRCVEGFALDKVDDRASLVLDGHNRMLQLRAPLSAHLRRRHVE